MEKKKKPWLSKDLLQPRGLQRAKVAIDNCKGGELGWTQCNKSEERNTILFVKSKSRKAALGSYNAVSEIGGPKSATSSFFATNTL
jgi:hypothetical protein